MSPHILEPEVTWPHLESSYIDEFGLIDQAVYEVGRNIWPAVVPYIRRTLRDLQAGQIVMMKAAALVSRKVNENSQEITNVHGYLYRTFVHLLSKEVEKEGKHAELNLAMLAKNEASMEESDEAVYEKILIHQLLARADFQTRRIFELRMLGHTFEEIASAQKMQSNHLRSEWSKEIRRLTALIESETRESERQVLQHKRREMKG
jgi:hypothetical protein